MHADQRAAWPTMAAAELLHPTLTKDDPHTANPRAALVAYYRQAAWELEHARQVPTPVNAGDDGRWRQYDGAGWLGVSGVGVRS